LRFISLPKLAQRRSWKLHFAITSAGCPVTLIDDLDKAKFTPSYAEALFPADRQ
jgi:hypothetical protein